MAVVMPHTHTLALWGYFQKQTQVSFAHLDNGNINLTFKTTNIQNKKSIRSIRLIDNTHITCQQRGGGTQWVTLLASLARTVATKHASPLRPWKQPHTEVGVLLIRWAVTKGTGGEFHRD